MNPAADCLRDDITEWLEFHGTAAERLGKLLAEADTALTAGRIGSALYLIRQAKTTHRLLASGIATARTELATQNATPETAAPAASAP